MQCVRRFFLSLRYLKDALKHKTGYPRWNVDIALISFFTVIRSVLPPIGKNGICFRIYGNC